MKINLIEYFVETVGRFGERVAVVDGERRVAFNELDLLARRAAGVINTSADCKNRPVAVFMPKCVDFE